MSFARVYSAQPSFLKTHIVTIEADLGRGLHSFSIVGLPDKAVEEAKDRVAAAIKNSGFTSPKSKNQKIVISLAPADIKKEGSQFDLSIALVYLLAAGDIQFSAEKILFLGELALDGTLRKIQGTLPCVREAKRLGYTAIFIPKENAEEAALIEGVTIFPAHTLREVIEHLNTKQEKSAAILPQKKTLYTPELPPHVIDFGDIRGQETAKRGLEIAAAGRHNIILYGPPGTGKTMLARAFSAILPPLTFEEALDVTAIHSIAGLLETSLISAPPFRSPHHTSSHIALVGGGTNPRPGEVTLAHRGVLFLDEFPEFERRTIDALRQPLEDKSISVSRAKGSVVFPANFILVGAMNPHSAHDLEGETPHALHDRLKMQRKISGPIVDRIDMWIEVQHIDHEKLSGKNTAESVLIRQRVQGAREVQERRFADKAILTNSEMSVRDIDELITLSPDLRGLLNVSAKKLNLSPRAYHRSIKLARTIADLARSQEIQKEHLLEALQYRPRNLFQQ